MKPRLTVAVRTLVAFALQAALVKDLEYGLAFSALGLGAFYLAAATMLWQRAAGSMRLLAEAFLALGVVFASLAIPLALDGRWTAAAWALEGAATWRFMSTTVRPSISGCRQRAWSSSASR